MTRTGRNIVLFSICFAVAPCCADGKRFASVDEECAAGVAEACGLLGELRLRGRGAPKSRREGREAFERACDLGHGPSCGMAGSLLYAREDDRARRLLGRGCELGHLRSCTTWAWMLLHGEGGPADRDGAAAAFDRACALGDSRSCAGRERP